MVDSIIVQKYSLPFPSFSWEVDTFCSSDIGFAQVTSFGLNRAGSTSPALGLFSVTWYALANRVLAKCDTSRDLKYRGKRSQEALWSQEEEESLREQKPLQLGLDNTQLMPAPHRCMT